MCCPIYFQAYGEIYFKAWKVLASVINPKTDFNAMEEYVLQELFYASLHLATSNMVSSIHAVLRPFFDKKKSPEVDAMLYKMYEPIMWRAFKVANEDVRVNACAILSHTFPLHDPKGSQCETEDVIVKTVSILKNILLDDVPKVRVAAIEATVKILGAYWDAISSSDIRSLLDCKFKCIV